MTSTCALVTGAGAGIGRATALVLAQQAAADVVIAADINIEQAEATAALIIAAGGQARAEYVDASSEDSINQLFDRLDACGDQLIIALNNAGLTTPPARIHKISSEAWTKISAVNIDGVWHCMQRELAIMARNKRGSIVNMASISGLHGATFAAPYSATKHAVIGMTKSAAAEYGGIGVRVNAVCPGAVNTAMIHAAFDDSGIAALKAKNPMGRLCEPEEVANAVAFLVSEQAGFINGHALVVDGGSTIYQ